MKVEPDPLNLFAPQPRPENAHPGRKKSYAEIVWLASKVESFPRAIFQNETSPGSIPTGRADRVQDLRRRVASGVYTIPYMELAHRLYPVLIGQV